ncbi:hypothetical protein JIG36_51085 [Actinoplanes sp. LDG1-06]|uniref:Uncharacterized protein n=1 Tax=Paractinoplanes ovalisporus TaxID=2810368 RepID=A0ABS2AVG4_9ACTN|nr:hypothetical protein [Actinoplanes ovalisporus]MBM2623864.1 hypothetical protein [Actinoplanes ovalisporus]
MLSAAERAAAIRASIRARTSAALDDGDDQDDAEPLDQDDQDDADQDDDPGPSTARALRDLARQFLDSRTPRPARNSSPRPVAAPDNSGPPAPKSSGSVPIARLIQALGFSFSDHRRRVPGACPILVGGRECPSLGVIVEISWSNPAVKGTVPACVNCAHSIRQASSREGEELPDIRYA